MFSLFPGERNVFQWKKKLNIPKYLDVLANQQLLEKWKPTLILQKSEIRGLCFSKI